MRQFAAVLLLVLLAGCDAKSGTAPPPSEQNATPTASTQLNGDTYTVTLPTGADKWDSAVVTAHGIVWTGPQAQTGQGMEQHPTEPLKLYLSPVQKGGADLAHGSQELFTFPLTVPNGGGQEYYVSSFQIADAGDWAAILLSLRAPRVNQGPFRLDAVNLKTREHRIITDAHLSGGMHFTWRAEPRRVFWEQQSLTATGEAFVAASKAIDLETGKVSDVPPGTAKKK